MRYRIIQKWCIKQIFNNIRGASTLECTDGGTRETGCAEPSRRIRFLRRFRVGARAHGLVYTEYGEIICPRLSSPRFHSRSPTSSTIFGLRNWGVRTFSPLLARNGRRAETRGGDHQSTLRPTRDISCVRVFCVRNFLIIHNKTTIKRSI